MRELLGTARKLLTPPATDSDVRRAVSSIYYALYHHLSAACCDLLVRDPTLGSANYQVYRALEHGLVRAACLECIAPGRGFPIGIVRYAETFNRMQTRRLAADYDPAARMNSFAAIHLISVTEAAIAAFDVEPERHRRAFALLVAVRRRGRG